MGSTSEEYSPLLGILAAAQAPLTMEQLVRFTGLSRQKVRRLLRRFEQFIDPIGAGRNAYRLYHQSVVDFLAACRRGISVDFPPTIFRTIRQ
jgi:hypothetical protein